MGEKSKIERADGAVWNTVKFTCPKCHSYNEFEFHLIDDEQHYIMRCTAIAAGFETCGWQTERYTHLPSDAPVEEWPHDPVSDETQKVEVLVPLDDDGNVIAEVDNFRGKDCDEVLPAVADELGETVEER